MKPLFFNTIKNCGFKGYFTDNGQKNYLID